MRVTVISPNASDDSAHVEQGSTVGDVCRAVDLSDDGDKYIVKRNGTEASMSDPVTEGDRLVITPRKIDNGHA